MSGHPYGFTSVVEAANAPFAGAKWAREARGVPAVGVMEPNPPPPVDRCPDPPPAPPKRGAYPVLLETNFDRVAAVQPAGTPHKCPVCEGRGDHDQMFYAGVDVMGTSNTGRDTCRSCDGKGVIWEGG